VIVGSVAAATTVLIVAVAAVRGAGPGGVLALRAALPGASSSAEPGHPAAGTSSPSAVTSPPGGIQAAKPAQGQPAPQPSGILNTHESPFRQGEFTVRDAWHGPVGSTWLLVYAGGSGTGQHPGGLRLFTETHGGGEPYTTYVGAYDAPGADSPLTITGVSGTTMVLQSDSGRTYHFDLKAKRFI